MCVRVRALKVQSPSTNRCHAWGPRPARLWSERAWLRHVSVINAHGSRGVKLPSSMGKQGAVSRCGGPVRARYYLYGEEAGWKNRGGGGAARWRSDGQLDEDGGETHSESSPARVREQSTTAPSLLPWLHPMTGQRQPRDKAMTTGHILPPKHRVPRINLLMEGVAHDHGTQLLASPLRPVKKLGCTRRHGPCCTEDGALSQCGRRTWG